MTSPAWQEQVKGYLPLVIAGVSTVFIAVRLLIVAGLDPETAYGILQATGTATVAVGAMISAIGPAVALCGAYCLAQWLAKWIFPSSDNYSISSRRRLLAIAIIGFVFSLFFSPPIVIFVYGVVLSSLSIRNSTGLARHIYFLFLGFLLIFVPIYFIASPIWIPSEQLALRDSKPVTAYVLSSTAQDVTILVKRSGKIKHIKPSDMIGRTPCEIVASESDLKRSGTPHFSPIFYQIIITPIAARIASRYPQCPQ